MGSTAKGQPGGLATLGTDGALVPGQYVRTATASLNFASTASGAVSTPLTVSVPGAAVGSLVVLGAPAALEAGLIAFGLVSAADTVSIRLLNASGGTVDPAAATWKVGVLTA